MIVVIDNYDSFTWNLVQLLGALGQEVVVFRNDETTVERIEARAPDRIVISPGPGTPADAGISVECVRRLGSRIPILGVCLGHQAIGVAYGARVARARRLMHGKVSPVVHDGTDLFEGLPSPVNMTRYHSLVLDPHTIPDDLQVLARTGQAGWEDEVHAVRHGRQRVWGVQFHPESIASDGGERVMRNFLALSA